MTGWKKTAVAALFCALGGITPALAGVTEDMARAQALMQAGKPGEAYALLERIEFDNAGNIAFDTLLGIAALDGGHPDKATLAFERVLAQTPNSAGVRLDMARAYFALGDYASAKRELAIVTELDPPPAAKVIIERYQTLIEEKERAQQTSITAYVEGSYGSDDNVTSVTSDFTRAVQATYNLSGFQPTGNSVKRLSDVGGINVGAELSHKIDESLSLHAGADRRQRMVTAAKNYDSEQYDARLGLSYTREADTWRGGVVYQDYRQKTDTAGTTANRNSNGLSLEWRRALGPNDQAGLFGTYTQQRFQDVPTNDIDSTMVGASWLHLFSHDLKPILYSSLLAGQDEARKSLANGSNVSKDNWGARFYGQISPRENFDLYASLGYLDRTDRKTNARSTTVGIGKDRMNDLTLGANWRFAKDWLLRPQIIYSENNSNVALSEYKRTEITVTLRHDFR